MMDTFKNEFGAPDKREMFQQTLQKLLAVDLPTTLEEHEIVYFYFHKEEYLMQAVYCLQDYVGKGFSLIIENVDVVTVNLKIYEPDSDDFIVLEGVPVKANSFDIYKRDYKKTSSYSLSVGLLEIINGDTTIRKHPSLIVPLLSVSFVS